MNPWTDNRAAWVNTSQIVKENLKMVRITFYLIQSLPFFCLLEKLCTS